MLLPTQSWSNLAGNSPTLNFRSPPLGFVGTVCRPQAVDCGVVILLCSWWQLHLVLGPCSSQLQCLTSCRFLPTLLVRLLVSTPLSHALSLSLLILLTVCSSWCLVLIFWPPKGGRGCLMSPPCLESQGCHLIPLCYLLSCSSA